MPIKIVRNNAGNCINFLGTSNPVYWNACLSAEANAVNSDNINIRNDIRSAEQEEVVYEFFDVPYTEFRDKDGNSFDNVTDAVDYITEQSNVVSNTGKFILSATDTLDFEVDNLHATILLDNGDYYPVNTLHAEANDDGNINITTVRGDIIIYKDLRVANATINGVAVNSTLATAVNELNSLFSQSSSVGNVPVITSSLAISLVEGNTLNYTVTATDAVAWEWSNLPAGVATTEGNVRTIIGGSGLAIGTYNITVRAINYYGYDEETVVLTVSAPPFADTKSLAFPDGGDYCKHEQSGNPYPAFTGVQKAHNGNASNWSISFWHKPGNTTASNQTVWSFASHIGTWDNFLEMRWKGSASLMRYYEIYITDNSQANGPGKLVLETPVSGSSWPIAADQWHHVVVTNSGTDYTSTTHGLKFYLNGSLVTNTGGNNLILTQQNYGGVTTGAIDAKYFLLGRSPIGNSLDQGKLDEVAFWNDTLTQTEVTEVYNSGSALDLSTMTNQPDHWYRMGDDSDVYPTIYDMGASANDADLTMVNMSVSDFVSDTP